MFFLNVTFWCFLYFCFFLFLLQCSTQAIFLWFFWIVYIINIARIVYTFDLHFKGGPRIVTGLIHKDLYWYLKLSKLKPIHAETISKVYGHLKTDKGEQFILNGFRAAGITVKKIRENPKSGFNPYWINCWVDFVVLKKKCCCARNKTIAVL